MRLFATHSCTLADFKALVELTGSMGPSGLRPCPSCSNIVKDDLADGHALLGLSSLEAKKWKLHTDQSVRDIQAHLCAQKGLMAKTRFTDLQSRLGFHYAENGILNDKRFQIMRSLRYDWPHAYLQQGLFGKELEAFMAMARDITPQGRKAIVTYQDLHDYVASWTWASCKSIFARERMTASMSEQVSVAPLARHFFHDIILAEPSLQDLHEAGHSAMLVCEVVETLQCASRCSKLVPPCELAEKMHNHLEKHVLCSADVAHDNRIQ